MSAHTEFVDDARYRAFDGSPIDEPIGPEADAGNGHAPDPAALVMLPKRIRADMQTRRLRFIATPARALPRGLVLNLSGSGGVGKTRLILQWLAEMCLGLAPFGEEMLRPDGAVRALYIGAEDREPLFNEMALPLLAKPDDTLPFDVLLLEEMEREFALDAPRAVQLATFIADNGPYDVVAIEPLSALVPADFADAVANQFIARKWQRIGLGPLLRACPDAAFLVGAHDTKAGQPMSGSGDFINFGRSGLQLRAAGAPGVGTDVPEGSIEMSRFKDNVGFRFKRMILSRDPDTLLLTATSTETAYGAGVRRSRRTQAEIEQYLATQAQRFLQPSAVPDSERTRAKVEATLLSHAARDGVEVSARGVERFVEAYCSWRTERQGRSTVKILEAVTDPGEAEGRRYGD